MWRGVPLANNSVFTITYNYLVSLDDRLHTFNHFTNGNFVLGSQLIKLIDIILTQYIAVSLDPLGQLSRTALQSLEPIFALNSRFSCNRR